MKRFSDFGIKPANSDKAIFEVPQISITDILNCEIEVFDFQSGIKTKHGENRYIVKIKYDGTEYKFFTDAKPIKDVLDQIPKENFPFITVIKQKKFGSGSIKTYEFT